MPLRTDDLDDLLGGNEEPPKPPPIDELDLLLQDDMQATARKSSSKTKTPKEPKEPREQRDIRPRKADEKWVRFYNKGGEEIVGPGSVYYVVRQGGKLHYKQEGSVHFMTEEEVTAWLLTQ